jgi:hypothetical protein
MLKLIPIDINITKHVKIILSTLSSLSHETKHTIQVPNKCTQIILYK